MIHLQNGDQGKGKAAEISHLPNRDSRLYLVPQETRKVDGEVSPLSS